MCIPGKPGTLSWISDTHTTVLNILLFIEPVTVVSLCCHLVCIAFISSYNMIYSETLIGSNDVADNVTLIGSNDMTDNVILIGSNDMTDNVTYW